MCVCACVCLGSRQSSERFLVLCRGILKCFPSLPWLISSACSSRTFQHLLTMLSAAERSPVCRKSGWSLAEGGLDLIGGRAAVLQSRASWDIEENTRWTKCKYPNQREEENGRRWMSGGKHNQRFWHMKCQVNGTSMEFLPPIT